jgi:hypothetical protein
MRWFWTMVSAVSWGSALSRGPRGVERKVARVAAWSLFRWLGL